MNTSPSDNHVDDINVGVAATPTSLVVFIFELGMGWQESNTQEGIKNILNKLSLYRLSRILVEAKGACVRHFVKACTQEELPIIIVHPMEVIERVKEREPLAKIEQVDARLIAYLGATIKPEPHPVFSKKLHYIEELIERKQQLNAIKAEEMTRQPITPTAVANLHTDFIKLLEKEIATIEQTISEEIAERREWQYVYEILSAPPIN